MFCYVKLAANDNTIGGNLKTGVIPTSLLMKFLEYANRVSDVVNLDGRSDESRLRHARPPSLAKIHA